VPYLSCPACGLSALRGPWTEPSARCPRCGSPTETVVEYGRMAPPRDRTTPGPARFTRTRSPRGRPHDI